MKGFFLSIFLFASPFVLHGQEDLRVVKQVGPVYSHAARAVRAIGHVGVEVKIDNKGKVVEAKAFSGHPLLKATSEAAAKLWLFSPVDDQSVRTTLLSFIFNVGGEVRYIPESEISDEAVTTHNFLHSLAAEVTYEILVPRLLLLPRDKGAIKVEKCPLHKDEMSVGIRSCNTEVTEPTFTRSETYDDAEDEFFPKANVLFYGHGCGYLVSKEWKSTIAQHAALLG